MTTKEKQQELIKFIVKELYPDVRLGSKLRKELDFNFTLSDVLRVIEKVKPVPDLELFNVELSISKYGTNGRDNCLWNLEKDFNNQSEEFYNWLYELLIKTV